MQIYIICCLLVLKFFDTCQATSDERIGEQCRSNATDCNQMQTCCALTCNTTGDVTVSLCSSNNTRNDWYCICKFQKMMAMTMGKILGFIVGGAVLLSVIVWLITGSVFFCIKKCKKKHGGKVIVSPVRAQE